MIAPRGHCPERRHGPHLHGRARLRHDLVRARRVEQYPRTGDMGDELLALHRWVRGL